MKVIIAFALRQTERNNASARFLIEINELVLDSASFLIALLFVFSFSQKRFYLCFLKFGNNSGCKAQHIIHIRMKILINVLLPFDKFSGKRTRETYKKVIKTKTSLKFC